MSSVATTCPYCGVGCGVLATPDANATVSVKGDPNHPANFGRLCSKGSALGETIGMEGRLLRPEIRGKEATWEMAVAEIARQFQSAIAEHGPESVAFYGSGQLLTEDYYVANKLMKGFIGAANIDTNSRLCMASSVAGHKRAFGSDTVPGTYEDLEEADLIVLVGSNLAWCHPVLYQRIAAAKADRPGMTVVNIDPRRTATCDLADLHLPLAPGSDVALFNGLLVHLAGVGATDGAFADAHVTGVEEVIAKSEAQAGQACAITGLDASELAHFYALWARTEKVVTVYSQGVNQSTSGTDKVNAILNCHLATGRIGKPGMGPFSVTGQPNAMGGREVGGLANMLACHLDIENTEHRQAVQDFWQSPSICTRPGLKAVDLFNACADGRIKALWIMSTNPAVSIPDADGVRDAIAACPFTVVSDILPDTDTGRLADVLLPALGWGEKSGTVTNSDRTISRQRPFLEAPQSARADWRAICDVAAAMGWAEAFDFEGPAAIFREHARLSGVAGQLGRDFDISGLAEISDADYDLLEPTRWPVSATRRGGRFFADGRFFTADGRARMVPVDHQPMAAATSEEYPLRLNTGRVRDHWHTMTRTARAPRLNQHIAEPYAEINPVDAARYGIEPADLVVVRGSTGRVVVRALITDRTARGVVFVPMHWTSNWSSDGRVDAAVAAATDPISGQPELKGSVVALSRFDADWFAFAAGSGRLAPDAVPGLGYWALAKTQTGWRAEIAGKGEPDWQKIAPALLGMQGGARAVSLSDPDRGSARVGLVREGKVRGVLFAAPSPVGVSRAFVVSALAEDVSIHEVLAGRPANDRPDPGATVCSCFDIGSNTIQTAILKQGLATVDEIGEVLRAGTNCGSCRPELRQLLLRTQRPMAAE
ncbi:MAG: molybdopterin-dependent oxidoreductase [Pseudomonadota bacterium]